MKQQEKTRLTRDRIISAGIKEFGTNGYSDANINHITESGIAKGLLYHNFSGKDELYLACLSACFEKVTTDLSGGECPDYNAYFDRQFKLFREEREIAAMVLESLVSPPQKHIEAISEISRAYDEMNSKWIRIILEDGEMRKNVDRESAMRYISVMQDMFNLYCLRESSACYSIDDMLLLHESKLPKFFDCLMYGIMRGND